MPVIIAFYSSRLEIILKGMSASPRGGEDAKIATLTNQICCLHLVSALYSRLERHLVHGPSDVTKQAADVLLANSLVNSVKGDGKELSQFLVKCLSEKRSLVCPESASKELVKLYRSFHCASLNCMVAVICCIQDTEKIYDRYIFKEITAKQELLWSRIVEVETEIVFGMEQSEVGKRRRQVVAVRRSGADNRAPVSSGYLQSHYLADSSLSQDVSRYDFTSSLGSGSVNVEASALQAGSDLQFLEVENSEIGRHPCLPSLIACIRHMECKAMYPTTNPTGAGQPQPPGWMRSVLAVLQSPDTSRNVLLFLLKLLLLCPDTFQPFSATFFAPILAILADGRLQGTEVFIDYFTSDLLILLLSWTSKCSIVPNTQEEKLSSSRVLSFLIRHIHNDRRDILRHNLELLRSVVELWRPALTLDIETVVDLLRSQESSGVQVLETLLTNKLGD